MGEFINIVVTLAFGFLGWLIAKKLKFPAAAMIGSMIAVAILNITFDIAYMPRTIKIFTQSVAGMFIGLQLRKEDIKDMKRMIKPILILLLFYAINTFICGTIIHFIARIDYLSAWFSCISGGLTDISLIAMDLNANTSAIVFMQSIRLVFTLGVFPHWIKFLTSRFFKDTPLIEGESDEQVDSSTVVKHPVFIVITVLLAVLGGYVGSLTGIPAGPIIGSMVMIAIINNLSDKLHAKRPIRVVAQVFSGALIGSTITFEMVLQFRYLLIPIVVLMIGYLTVNFIFGYICAKKGWLDYQTALFCSCPAGVSDMVLLAGDLGADMKKTGIIHITRLIYSSAVMPNLIVLVASLI